MSDARRTCIRLHNKNIDVTTIVTLTYGTVARNPAVITEKSGRLHCFNHNNNYFLLRWRHVTTAIYHLKILRVMFLITQKRRSRSIVLYVSYFVCVYENILLHLINVSITFKNIIRDQSNLLFIISCNFVRKRMYFFIYFSINYVFKY